MITWLPDDWDALFHYTDRGKRKHNDLPEAISKGYTLMATTTLPQRRAGISRGRWIWAGIAAIVLAIVAALLLTRTGSSSSAPTVSTTTVMSGNIVASVAGSGTVAAAQSLDLTFQTSGSVTHVLVKE